MKSIKLMIILALSWVMLATFTTAVIFLDNDDINLNRFIDKIKGVIPHSSSQYNDASITILNVQSYPYIGGNWTVRFDTTGTANLTITAIDTSYTEAYTDNSNTTNDLEILELKCGDNILFNKYDLTNKENIYLGLENNSLIKLNQTINKSLKIKSLHVENYNCDNLTGYHSVKVLSTGAHTLLFSFGLQNATAHNIVSGVNVSQGMNLSYTIQTYNATIGMNLIGIAHAAFIDGLNCSGDNQCNGSSTCELGPNTAKKYCTKASKTCGGDGVDGYDAGDEVNNDECQSDGTWLCNGGYYNPSGSCVDADPGFWSEEDSDTRNACPSTGNGDIFDYSSDSFSYLRGNCTSCYYNGSGNWKINASENCLTIANFNLGNSNFFLTNDSGKGNFTIEFNITSIGNWSVCEGCRIVIRENITFG